MISYARWAVWAFVCGTAAHAQVSIVNVPLVLSSGTQVPVDIALATPLPQAANGVLTLSFQSSVASVTDDPAIQFATGGRTVVFAVPAGTTQPLGSPIPFQTGTVAGSITLTVTIPGLTPFSQTSTIPPTAPVVVDVRIQNTSTDLTVVAVGYSNTRDLQQSSYTFSGTNLQSSTFSVSLAAAAAAWFQSPESVNFGGMFSLQQPFAVTGNPNDATGVSVVLTNSVGSSAPKSGAR
jgi:hypothetical protein